MSSASASRPSASPSRSEPARDRAASVSDRIASSLRDDILRGRYRPGDRLPSERELAERFGTHRGAAREALKTLEQLGIARILPGGARAAPIEEASLDIVQYLSELDVPPDPEIFDRIFEVFGGLFSLAGRLAAERATDAQRARVEELLALLTADDLPLAEEHAHIMELSGLFVEASQNMILALVRKGLYTRVIERIENREGILRPPDAERASLLAAIAKGIADRDGAATAEAVFQLSVAIRRQAVELLSAERERAGGTAR